jgi:hypothetical protein
VCLLSLAASGCWLGVLAGSCSICPLLLVLLLLLLWPQQQLGAPGNLPRYDSHILCVYQQRFLCRLCCMCCMCCMQ